MGDVIRKVKGGRFIGWYVRYRDTDGRRKQRASHQPSHALARRYLLEVEGRIARGLLGIPEPAPPAPTLNELCERFLGEYARPKIKDLGKYRVYARTALRRALPWLGRLPADKVQTADVEQLRQALSKRWAPSSVRLTLDFLSTVYTWAKKVRAVDHNPLHGIEKPPAQSSPEYLSQHEVQALLALSEQKSGSGLASDRMRHVCVYTALHTGLRRGELFGLRWVDLDLEARRLTVARSYRSTPKSGRKRQLRLPESVVPLLADWARDCPPTAEGVVFPSVSRTPRIGTGSGGDSLGLAALLKEAGCRVQTRPWHALRHTFASHFVMSGGNILSLQKVLGHSEIKMTLVYAHLAPEFLGDEMNKVKYR